MSVIRTASAIISTTAVILLASGAANAMAPKKSQSIFTPTVQSSLPDNNTPTSSLSGKAFFDRIANQGG